MNERGGLRGAALALAAVMATAPWRAVELGRSQQASWTEPHVTAYRDSTAFRAAWIQLFPIGSTRPSAPRIDFRKSRVIIVATGTKPTGGYRLSLASARATRDSAFISVTLYTPPRGCGVTEQLPARRLRSRRPHARPRSGLPYSRAPIPYVATDHPELEN